MVDQPEPLSRTVSISSVEGGDAPEPVTFGLKPGVFVPDFIQLHDCYGTSEIIFAIGLLPAERDRFQFVALLTVLIELSDKVFEVAGAKDEFVFGSIAIDEQTR